MLCVHVQILEAFAKADADGGGALEVAELRQVLRTLNSAVTEDEVQAIFARCDPSGDGHVTLAELLKAKRQTGKKKRAAPKPAAAKGPQGSRLAAKSAVAGSAGGSDDDSAMRFFASVDDTKVRPQTPRRAPPRCFACHPGQHCAVAIASTAATVVANVQ